MVAMRFCPGGCFRFVVGRGVLLCCTVCVFFWALLVVPAAHGQVIEEGGFPVKGGSISGESFSLSCPSRVFAEAGESVLLSCTATGVPEEGVRYEWESLSGDGLHLLSDANERSPLFTAPLSEAGAEYMYRLTAMSVGVYETATVTVVALGVSGGSVQGGGELPVTLEACDLFGVLAGDGEGCLPWEKAPSPDSFEGSPEDEGIIAWPSFPESPGAEGGKGFSGAGAGLRTPPYLECPSAVFLEELETGAIECHVSDAAGEEFLEYSWEPVGSTTRDYLDNPRLIPEDAPNPSVVAPETPVYETLESFHSGETTFRYRYRLTVTSRATGLSSSSEVEVFVSSSRPSVYCPLEVVVEEGSTVALDCEGVDPLSGRMDYDEDGASIEWEWEGLWGTSTAHLDETDLSSPLFTASPGSAGKQYHYIASMTSSASGVPRTARRRVTVTVSEGGAGAPIASDGIRLDNGQQSLPPKLSCPNKEAYEGESEIELACSISDDPGVDWTWTWDALGSTPEDLLSATNVHNPTFTVPDNVNGNTNYIYSASAGGTFGVTTYFLLVTMRVTVKERPDITVMCESPYDVDEGDDDFDFDCSASGAPGGDDPENYTWSWSPTTDLTGHTTATPTFAVPGNVDQDTTYTYTVTASAANAEDGTAEVTVTVRNTYTTAIHCPGNPYSVDEGSDRYELDCWVENPPTNVNRNYSFMPRGSTRNLDLIDFEHSDYDWPVWYFTAPASVDAEKTYEYKFTMAVGDPSRVIASSDITVTVRDTDTDTPEPVVTCNDSKVYEGASNFPLDCSVTNEPSGATYAWAARGSTLGTDDLTNTDRLKATFSVPDNVDADTDYDYTVTLSAGGADVASADVTVTVKNKFEITVTCPGNPYEAYEGADDIVLDCSASGAPEGAIYEYAWTPRGSTTNTNKFIAGTDGPKPTFDVPGSINSNETYEYTLTVSAGEDTKDGVANVTVTVLNKPSITARCLGNRYEVNEGSENFVMSCVATGAPGENPEYMYAWTVRGNTPDTALALLSGRDIAAPTFYVPGEVEGDQIYRYLVTVSAENAVPGLVEVTVTVKDREVSHNPVISVSCVPPSEVYEGSPNFALDCVASGAPGDDPQYTYAWTGDASAMALLDADDVASPNFLVPSSVQSDETYEYTLTVSADNAVDGVANVTVRVLNKATLSVVCTPSAPAYEGSADITLDCSASGAPSGSGYTYVWTARDGTPNTALLSRADIASPAFLVPEEVSSDETYEYTLTASAENAKSASADVTVKVLNKKALIVFCAVPASVYEGSDDVLFDCSASGAPGANPDYTYSWRTRGDTPQGLLSGVNISSPTFAVPDAVDEDETYEYTLTASAENAKSASADVTVKVLNKKALIVFCAVPLSVYEGSDDVLFDCSASGAPGANPDYTYSWRTRGDTPQGLLSGVNISSPTFAVPDAVDEDETYEYTLTVSADNSDTRSVDVTVKVLDAGTLALACTIPLSVYEGSDDVLFDCSASGAPGANPDYTYSWRTRGDTPQGLLSGVNISSPTFAVPDVVDEDETYTYTLTVSAANAEDATLDVAITVLNRRALSVVCADPPSVYEGSADFELDCSASGAPAGSAYEYAWTARGNTLDTSLLSATEVASPTFYVPDQVESDETYTYTLTVSAANAEDATLDVAITVLNRRALSVVCADPPSVYEGSADFELDCSASGAPAGSAYEYAWTARGNTLDTSLLSATEVASPTFYVPDQVESDETYTYRLTVSTSAENVDPGAFDLTVNVYDNTDLDVVCTDRTVYEGSPPFRLQCTASGGPSGVLREWSWSPSTHLTGPRIRTPTFTVPTNVERDTTFTYTATVTAGSMEDTGELTVTVLNSGVLALVCAMPPLVYEGAEDFAFDCTASGAPSGSSYAYAWTARSSTANTNLLTSGTDGPTPTFAVPDEVNEDETYEYLLTVSAANAESASAEVTVTVLDRAPLAFVDDSISGRVYVFTVGEPITDILLPEATGGLFPYTYTLTPALPNGLGLDDPTRTISGTPLQVSPRTEYTWQATDANTESVSLAFFIEVVPAAEPSPPVAESSLEVAEASSLGATVSTSSLRFGVQSAATEVSLDPMTDQISTHVSGPYHVGRMTLSPGGSEETRENGEMDLSVELASPVLLRREGGIEAASIILSPNWSLAESCEQLSSQTIGGLYTEVTLSDAGCRLLRFGGELDLTDVPSGRYAGSLDIILRSGESEETHTVDVDVTVIPAQRVITIGPGGVRFSTSRELPVGLTEEQNLSIYPDVAFLTEGKPHGVFELSNPSLIPLEISVSARFGYTEATENGREVVVEDASGSHLGDLSQVVDIHPGVLVLMPGEKGLVRYGMQEGALAAMAEKGYAAFFDVVSEPRQYVRSDQMPEEVTGDRTARVTMRVPGVYVPGEGASQLRAALLSISYVGSLSATFLVETQDHPFAGEVVAYDGDGRELGRRETLVYTRSRVRISLDRMPEEGAVFLRFSPRGSGRAPEPASIQWDAPRRDIGAADRDHTRPPATLVQKP